MVFFLFVLLWILNTYFGSSELNRTLLLHEVMHEVIVLLHQKTAAINRHTNEYTLPLCPPNANHDSFVEFQKFAL